MNIPNKLYLLVLVLSVFITGIGVYGISALKTMNQNTQTLYADRVLPMQQLSAARFAYMMEVRPAAQKVKSHLLTFSEAKKQVEKAQETVHANWQAYKLTYLTPEETQLAKGAEVSMGQADSAVEHLKSYLGNEDAAGLDIFIQKELYSATEPVVKKITALIDLQARVAQQVYENSKQLNVAASKKLWFLIGASLLFGFVLAAFIVGDTRRLIKSLEYSNRKIAASEEKCRALIENAGDAIMMLNQDTFITDVNDYACRLLGYSRAELLGMKISEIVPPEELEKQTMNLEFIKKNKGSIRERKMRRKDGSIVETESNTRILEGTGYITIIRDITERKNAELALKESEDKYHSLVEHAGDAIFIVSEDSSIVDVNYSACELLGYTRAELLTMKALDVYPHDELATPPVNWGLLKQNKTLLNERILQRKDGTKVEVEISRKLLANKKGYLAIVRDITGRKHIEEALRENERKYRSIFENIQDVSFQNSLDGIILETSPSVKSQMGYSREELIGTPVLNLYHNPADREPAFKILGEKGEVKDYEVRLKSRLSEPAYFSLSARLIYNPDGTPSHIDGMVRNITERKRIDEELAEHKEQMALFIEHSPAALAMLDTDMKYIATSRRFISDYNRGHETLIGKSHYEVFPETPEFRREIHQRCLKGAVEKREEDSTIRPDGEIEWFRWEIRPWHKATGEIGGIIIFTELITERKKAENDLALLNESLEQKIIDRTAQLQEANKALEAFSYSVSHDLRAPVRAVLGFTKIIQDDHLTGLSDEGKELFSYIVSSGTRMNVIIDDLLALARYERAKLNPVQVDMEMLIRRVWDELLLRHPHQATIQLAALPVVMADTSLIEQVVVNLISNAIKYSSRKEYPLVSVGFEKKDGTITYSVNDNGAGFDMKNYGRLFSAFQRLHVSSDFEGTGVGLLVVKRIIEKHGGVVWAEGKVNEGATFYFSLPDEIEKG